MSTYDRRDKQKSKGNGTRLVALALEITTMKATDFHLMALENSSKKKKSSVLH
jgi:hypothetical protein